jgi:hypothetical protein
MFKYMYTSYRFDRHSVSWALSGEEGSYPSWLPSPLLIRYGPHPLFRVSGAIEVFIHSAQCLCALLQGCLGRKVLG